MLAGCATTSSPADPLVLQARGAAGETTLRWAPEKTALVVVDMWDDHWCRSAAARVAEMAPAVDAAVRRARSRGVLVVHAPSTCVGFYKDHPARRRAVEAAFAKPPSPLSTAERWGTAWCWPDKVREPELPIDDSDMGCDCPTKCAIRDAWTRQIAAIGIEPGDAITDDGQELWNLFSARGIENVVILGVHLNMCVLGRPVGIRQLVKLGLNVALVRDLTDTMYDPRMRPRVDHHAGTALVVGHVEKQWCPTVTSVDLGAERPFRFAR